jgi:choline-sulfatase
MGAASAVPVLAQKKQAARRPNVVLIIADDLAGWMLGCYGNKEIRTPNIDMLAHSGTRFANSFVCTPVCSASRATLFTGRTPRQTGIVDYLTSEPVQNPPQGQSEIPASFKNEVMLSDILAGQGYQCGYAGKWHMGSDQQTQHGYKYWYTMPGGSSRYQNPQMNLNGEVVTEKGYLADLITQRACGFLDQQKADQPFFLTVSHFNPHMPYEGHPSKYYDMYAKTNFDSIGWEPVSPRSTQKRVFEDVVGNIRRCAAAVTALDDQLPPLLRKLEERGLRDNTIVIFTGDNGFLLGRHGLWGKGNASDPINMYEESVLTPMIWNWPGKTPIQGVRPELVSYYDFLPTVCDVTGVPLPQGRNLCGRSYLPLALGRPVPRNQTWRNLVFADFRNTAMARDSRYKVVLRNDGQGPNELYDVRVDPREKINQYDNAEFVSIRDHLTKELQDWLKKYSA